MARKRKPVRVEIPLSISIDDISLIGFISNNIKDHQLAYSLNSTFEIQLSREIDFESYDEAENILRPFSAYYCYDEDYNMFYFLIETRNNEGILLHQNIAEYNSILMIAHGNHKTIADNIMNFPDSIPGVFLCKDVSKIKIFRDFVKNSFLLDIDIYIRKIKEMAKQRELDNKEPIFFQL